MNEVYCISGFGADQRAFTRLSFGHREVHYLPWLMPAHDECIGSYAARMAEGITKAKPVLLGLSFGGMMAIEIAKLIPTEKIILISSVTNSKELPSWMKWAGKLKIDKIVPLRSFKLIEPLENYNLGIETPEERQLVASYRNKVDPHYTSWAVHQILNWKNTWIPGNLIHIHGGRDHIFPLRKIKPDFIIEDGGHFMVMNRADKINAILVRTL